MDKTEFLTIYGTFENLAVVKQTLPSVIRETRRNDARLIVHDSSVNGRREKWDYLLELNRDQDFHLILSDNMSMAHARNMCLHLGQELYAPDYICMLEDDHGYEPGLIPAMIGAMKTYYGKPAPNGLRYGLFTACAKHFQEPRQQLDDGNSYPDPSAPPFRLGGANSCFRCAPTQHWQNVLKGYDTDEYLISVFQTVNLNLRNYNKGFTTLIVQDGRLSFDVPATGRGFTGTSGLRLWDDAYTASDQRSRYLGRPAAGPGIATSALLESGERLYAQGDPEGARDMFAKVLERDPNHPDALNNLMVLAWESGDVAQTLGYMEQALTSAPLHRDVISNAVGILRTLERTEEAQLLCTTYLATHPEDGDMQLLMQQIGRS